MPNPPSVAGAAAHLYYCLNHVGDGLDEFTSRSTTMSYLHMGQELWNCRWTALQVSLEAIAVYKDVG